jgi:UDP-N-acetylglucosamine:LPS N-acetylglucosamine transferase
VAFNPSLAGKICGKKVFLHESDTIPGLVNKIVGKFADKIFL